MASVGQILVTSGTVALLAAVVGGGLKAFGLELPVISETKRQVLIGLFGAALLYLGLVEFADQPGPVSEAATPMASDSSTLPPVTTATLTEPDPAKSEALDQARHDVEVWQAGVSDSQRDLLVIRGELSMYQAQGRTALVAATRANVKLQEQLVETKKNELRMAQDRLNNLSK